MTDFPRIPDDDIEAYLDQSMNPDERRTFEERMANAADLQSEVKERMAIDEALRGHFQPPDFATEQIEGWLTDSASSQPGPPSSTRSRRLTLGVGLAIAASAAWLLVLSQRQTGSQIEPFFQPRSLVEIYEETVDQGFRPYYLCDDDERFAQTFVKRQQVPLRLAALPPKRSMAGLSYLGGLSRDTTAMLCFVDEQPVLVFVDRQEQQENAIVDVPEDSPLFIHEATLDDLIMYEVSPHAESRILDFLQVAEPPTDR